ncbi:unnamed protein product, partial [Prorocentrum cordatum]
GSCGKGLRYRCFVICYVDYCGVGVQVHRAGSARRLRAKRRRGGVEVNSRPCPTSVSVVWSRHAIVGFSVLHEQGYELVHSSLERKMVELTKGERFHTFLWQESYLSYDQAVEKGCDLIDWIGNRWADFFTGHAEWAQKLDKSDTAKVVTANVPAANIEYHDFWHDPAP